MGFLMFRAVNYGRIGFYTSSKAFAFLETFEQLNNYYEIYNSLKDYS